MRKNNRLLVVGIGPVWKENNKHITSSPFNIFFSSFLEYFANVYIAIPFFKKSISPKGIPMPDNIEVIPLPQFYGNLDLMKKLPIIFKSLISILKNEISKSDAVLIEYNGILGFVTVMLARKLKVPHLLLIGDNMEKVISNKYSGIKKYCLIWLNKLLENIIKHFIDKGLIVLATGNELIERFSTKGHHVYPYFTSLISDKDIVYRKPQDISLNFANILYAGFLTENKGIHIFLQAFAKFREKYHAKEAKLHIAGDGYFRSYLETLCGELDISNNVIFHGFISDRKRLKQLFLNSDLFVLPSKSEGIPKVLLEAMAYGVPILTTNVGGIPDIVKDGVNGLMVPHDSVEDLVEGMVKILSNIELRQKLVEGGYAFIREHTKERQAKKIVGYLFS